MYCKLSLVQISFYNLKKKFPKRQMKTSIKNKTQEKKREKKREKRKREKRRKEWKTGNSEEFLTFIPKS